MTRLTSFFVPFAFFLALAAGGCSSSSSSSGDDSGAAKPCNESGGACPTGQTCWPENASTFACLNEGPGKAGDPCQNTPGTPTCAHGLVCLQQSLSGGTCLPYCDPTNPAEACPAGSTCQTAVLGGVNGPQFQVCIGAGPADAGSDTGAGADTGTGGDTGAASDTGADAPADAGSGG